MQRVEHIDYLKGFAILMVLLGHIFIAKAPAGTHYPFCEMIYSFHMSLFFFVSGFLAYKTNKIKEKGAVFFLKKRAVSLLVPYLFWLLIAPYFIKNSYPTNIKELINKFYFIPNLNYWFLPLLFIYNIIYLLYYKLTMGRSKNQELKVYSLICLIGLSIGLVCKQYYVVVYTIYFASFMFGHYLSKYNNLELFITQKHIYGSSAILLCIMWKFFPIEPNGDKFLSLANLVALFICSYTACIVFYTFFKQIHLAKPSKWYLSEMGKYTLALYLLPLFFFTNNFEWTNCYTHALINIEALGIAILQSFIAYGIAKIIDEIPYIRTFLLGKQ